MISVYLFLPETHKENRPAAKKLTPWKAIHNIKVALIDKEVAHIYKANFFYYTGFTFFTSFSGLYLVREYGIGESQLGTYFAIIGICIVITQAAILRLISNRWKPIQVLRFSMIAVGVTTALTPFMPTLLFQYTLIPFIAVPQGLSMANLGALLSTSVSKEKQGVALGINGSLSAFSQGIVPLLGGIIAGLLGVRFPFLVGGISTLYAWYAVVNFKNTEGRQHTTNTLMK